MSDFSQTREERRAVAARGRAVPCMTPTQQARISPVAAPQVDRISALQIRSRSAVAGQHAGYLAEQMRLYRNGKRAHEIMTVVAKGLTEGEIDEIVAWCSSIKVEVKVPD